MQAGRHGANMEMCEAGVSTKILIVERHPVVAMGLGRLFQQQPDMTVVGYCQESRRAVESANELHPNLVVLDPLSGGVNGILLIGEIVRAVQQTRIVAFAAVEEPATVMEILDAGAAACVSKRSTPEEIIQGVRSVAEGGSYVDANLLRNLCPPDPAASCAGSRNGRNELTERESSVLRRVAQGYIAKEIAAELGVSQKSVETYKTRGMRKLGLLSRPEVVRYASRQGWFEGLRRVTPAEQERAPAEQVRATV